MLGIEFPYTIAVYFDAFYVLLAAVPAFRTHMEASQSFRSLPGASAGWD